MCNDNAAAREQIGRRGNLQNLKRKKGIVMKRNLILASTLVLAAACADTGNPAGSGTPTNSSSQSIVGTWSKCLEKTHDGAPSRKLKTKTFYEDGTYVRTDWYFLGTSCDAANQSQIYKKKRYLGTYAVTGDVEVPDLAGTITARTIDLNMKEFYRTYYGAEANDTHCGLSWSSGVEQNMIGQTCGDTTYQAGAVYEIFYVHDAQMWFGHIDNEAQHHHTGTSPSERPNEFGSTYTSASLGDYPSI